MKFSSNSQKYFEKMINRYNKKKIHYVILRGYEHLPEKTTGQDIDIYVDESDFQDAMNVTKSIYPEDPTQKTSVTDKSLSLLKSAISNPKNAILTLLIKPQKIINHLRDREKHNFESDYNVSEAKFIYGDMEIHLHNHIGYESPLTGKKRRVNKEVEKSMLENKNKESFYYTPSPPDELAHLICRGVFIHYRRNGFPDYYIKKCNELKQKVTSHGGYDDRFKKLLSELFFSCDDLVYGLVMDGKYDNIRDELESFSKY